MQYTILLVKILAKSTVLAVKSAIYDTFTGKQHTEETKKLMSEIKKGTGNGEKNSQFGTCWITKDYVDKKIKKEYLQKYLSNGWIKGRYVRVF